jgi:hypothetical protein
MARRLGLLRYKYGIRQPILVFQPGKVGSRSVFASLKQLNLDVPVYHAHRLNDLHVAETWARENLADPRRELEMVAQNRMLYAQLQSADPPRFNIISLVRAPIPRMISSFFQYLPVYVPEIKQGAQEQTLTGADLAGLFVTKRGDRSHEKWFDEQIKALFDLDVYATPFAHARGYHIYENPKARLLIIRLEDMSRVFEHAMHEFLSLPPFELTRTNVADKKWYAGLYNDFVNALRLPPSFVNEIHSSCYAEYFYTREELAASVARWT